MTLNDANINDITKHLDIIEKEACQIGNYSGEYNHKFNILKSLGIIKNTLNIKENQKTLYS